MKIVNTNSDESFDFKKLCDDVKSASGTDRLFMSFSIGADSIASLLQIIEEGNFDISDGVYWYYYYTPGIHWVNEYIEYFQDKFNIKIIKTPSEIFLKDMMYYNFQTPLRSLAVQEFFGTEKEIRYMKKGDIENFVKKNQHLPQNTLTAVGIKSGDSPIRRISMRKLRGICTNKKKWYPIWNFENGDVIKIIKRHNLKMPYDYDLFGISFENIDYRFSKVIKEKEPDTWKYLLDWFPLLEMNLQRTEYYHPEWAKPKKGIFYQKFDTLKPGEYCCEKN